MTRQTRESRSQMLQRLDEALRKVGAQSVLISDLVATRVGLNSTDLECLDLLYLAGVTTAGALSRHTGLTSGATTAVIDRLERAGFVRRKRDARDRRRVLVEVLQSSAGRIEPLYAPLAAGLAQLNEKYRDRQLAVIVDYLSRAMDVGADHVAWLQAQPLRSRRAATRRTGKRAVPSPAGGAVAGTGRARRRIRRSPQPERART